MRGNRNRGHIHDADSDGNIFTCRACHFSLCTTHNMPMHDGITCEQYDEEKRIKDGGIKAEEEASIKKIRKISKKCPGVDCGINMQKNEGCDHMTCKSSHIFYYCNGRRLTHIRRHEVSHGVLPGL
jgi:hypothetical protein